MCKNTLVNTVSACTGIVVPAVHLDIALQLIKALPRGLKGQLSVLYNLMPVQSREHLQDLPFIWEEAGWVAQAATANIIPEACEHMSAMLRTHQRVDAPAAIERPEPSGLWRRACLSPATSNEPGLQQKSLPALLFTSRLARPM